MVYLRFPFHFRKTTTEGGQPLLKAAFSLVEVVLAVGITAFAILAILGLLGVGMSNNAESERQIEAANLATQILTRYKEALVAPPSVWESPLPKLNAIGSTPLTAFSPPQPVSNDGKPISGQDADYALSHIVWNNPRLGSRAPYTQVNCSVKLMWPAAAALESDMSAAGAVSSYVLTTSFLVKR